jgi:sigma-B regulation protein RsbU (phosphoserine phosphatase)
MTGGRVGLVIGDVAGKGISAALLMARLGSELRFHAAGRTDPKDILARVNDSLEPSAAEGMFATVCMLVLEPQTGQVTFSNAGHPAPIVRLPDGRTIPFGTVGGAPLGLAESRAITQQARMLEPGSAIVLFTDGVTEALNAKSELFGTDKLEKTVGAAKGDAEVLKTTIVDAVRRFRGTAAQADDLTVLTLAREPVAARASAAAT